MMASVGQPNGSRVSGFGRSGSVVNILLDYSWCDVRSHVYPAFYVTPCTGTGGDLVQVGVPEPLFKGHLPQRTTSLMRKITAVVLPLSLHLRSLISHLPLTVAHIIVVRVAVGKDLHAGSIDARDLRVGIIREL